MKKTPISLSPLNIITVFIIIIGTLFLITSIVIFSCHFNVVEDGYIGETNMAKTGQIGDFIGGILGPIFSLVGVFLVYETLNQQRIQIDESEEKQLNREDLIRLTDVVYRQIERYDVLANNFNYLNNFGIRAVQSFSNNLQTVVMIDKNPILLNSFPDNHIHCVNNINLLNAEILNFQNFIWPLANSVNALKRLIDNSKLSDEQKISLREVYFSNIGYFNIELLQKIMGTFDSAIYYKANMVNISAYTIPEFDVEPFAKVFMNASSIMEFISSKS